MRPLYHPAPEEISVQGIVHALADPVWARIMMQLMGTDQCQNCTAFLTVCGPPLPKSTLSKHLVVLREAGLIRSMRRGVELYNQTRCADLTPRFGNLINAIIDAYRAEMLAETKRPAPVEEAASLQLA
jgi:predicted transcriptional regulator